MEGMLDAMLANIQINGSLVACGTVHLESLNTATLRKQQLEKAGGILHPFPTSFLVGDFNFDADINYPQLEKRVCQHLILFIGFRENNYQQPTLRTLASHIHQMIYPQRTII
jgi:hypothetical protein